MTKEEVRKTLKDHVDYFCDGSTQDPVFDPAQLNVETVEAEFNRENDDKIDSTPGAIAVVRAFINHLYSSCDLSEEGPPFTPKGSLAEEYWKSLGQNTTK